MQNQLLIVVILSVALYISGYFRTIFIYAGLLLQSYYIFSRGMLLGRLPLVGPHDTLFFLSVSLVLFALPVAWKMKNRKRFLNSITASAVFFIFLSLLYRPYDAPLPPVLSTFWFEAHVALSFFSYALFAIAAVLGILYLVEDFSKGGRGGIVKESEEDLNLSSQKDIEILQYKAVLVGFCLFSVAMVFGGIWAYLAWGTYWLWTPKELWTVILWLFYSLYLHARLRKWWAGKPSVILGIIGFAIVMFTYLGVSLFMKSSHAF